MLRSGLLLLGALLVLAGPVCAERAIRSITAAVLDAGPVVDGKLTDDCWQFCQKAYDFQRNDGKGSALEGTVGYVGHDDRNLVIGFDCFESNMDKTVARFTKDGEPVWQDDCVEFFLAPHGVASRSNYYHFVVNMNGAKTVEVNGQVRKDIAWSAAALKGIASWSAEIVVPFASLQPIGENEDCWRINFCRHETPRNEDSSWSEVAGSFHSFWRFGRLKQPPGGLQFIKFHHKLGPVPRPSEESRLEILPADAPLPPGDETPIIPAPRELKAGKGQFVITRQTPIVVGDKITAMDRRAAEEISQEVRGQLGFSLSIIPAAKLAKGVPAIVVGEPAINARVKKLCAERGRVVTKDSPGREGYVLEITPSAILVAGSDQEGTFWGAETLRQLIRPADAGKGFVRAALVRDWPKMGYRGVHLLTSPDGLAFHTRCIEQLFSRYKINNIVLEAEHVRWDSHPEIYNPARGMSKSDVRKLIEVARKHHITVTPLIQSLGHMEWAFYKGNNTDLAEDAGTPYAFCPLNEKANRFIFSIMDEAIELFGHPKYMHIGHDEFNMRARFPVHAECAKIGREQLYIDDTLKIYKHLKSRGVGTMMWGDVLLTQGYREKIAQLPKDILICDWHYGPAKDFPSLDVFRSAGLRTIGCTWYDPQNLAGFSAAAARRKAMGMLQTTWTGFNASPQVLQKEFHQIYAYILGAEWAWSPSGRTPEKLPYDPERVFSEIWGGVSTVNAKHKFYALPVLSQCNLTPVETADKLGWLGYGTGEDVSAMPVGVMRLGGIPFEIQDPSVTGAVAILLRGPSVTSDFPERTRGIKVGLKVKALHFIHATGWEAAPNAKVGDYQIRYAAGNQAGIDLIYGKNITSWLDGKSTAQGKVAWRGRTASGRPIVLRTLTWENPTPDKEVEFVQMGSAGTEAGPLLLAITAETE